MKLLLVHNRYRSASPSGEDRVVDQESAALASAGHEVGRFEVFSDDIDTWPVRRKATVPGKVVWCRAARRELAACLRKTRPDLVHIHNTFPLLSPSVLYACRDERVPAVVTFHNYRPICPSGDLFRNGAVCHDCIGHYAVPSVKHGCYRDSALATAPLAMAVLAHRTIWRRLPSAYIFLSNAQRDLFDSLGLPDSRVFVKPNLIPVPPPAAVPRQHKVVYLGRLSDTKGLPILMAAWDCYRRGRSEGGLGLVIAGSGPLEAQVRRWAENRPGVEVPGLLDRQSCSRLVAGARAVVAPSQWEETFGLVVVEAMAAGVPPIASDRGSFPELIRHDVDGILFESGNVTALAGVLQAVDESPDRFAELGRQARLTYERNFDPDANLEQLLRIYRFAIAQPVWA